MFYDTCWGKIGIYQEDKKDEMTSTIRNKFIGTKLDIINGITSDDFMREYSKKHDK